MSANDHQIGGNHYARHSIQPWDYIVSNELGYLEGNVVSCTVEINRKKTDITLDEIEMIYKAIKKAKKGIFESEDNGDN